MRRAGGYSVMGSHGQRHPAPGMLLILGSCLACLYVAGRLWNTTREITYLRREMKVLAAYRRAGQSSAGFPYIDSPPAEGSNPLSGSDEGILFYSIRSGAGPASPLQGSRLEDDGIPIQPLNDHLMGQIDSIEAGEMTGWACMKGYMGKPLQVVVYVDGVKVGEVPAAGETPHHIIHRLCELDMGQRSELEQPPQQLGVGFRIRLPDLQQGRHEVRAFVKNIEGTGKQELNQSPLPFVETAAQPGLEEALKRKDSIIRVRNAQISALWDELHTRQPWRNALKGNQPITLHEDGNRSTNGSRYLAVIGINTGLGAQNRREILRKTWVPSGKKLKDLEDKTGIVIRFVVGYSEQKDDPDELRIQQEIAKYNDILRLDLVDTYNDLSLKTLKMFSVLPAKYDADFYFKIDDDVAVNVYAMADYLAARRTQGNLYLGCMKSGQVLTDRRYKWFEPEYWRFGDPASSEGQINYMRHASGQVYGLSAPVARYIGRNAPILHRFANEDVTLGAWLVGLEVTHVDERRMCCDSAEKCAAQTSESNLCLSYYEHQCAGICSSESRLEPIFRSCLDDPLHKNNPGAGVATSDSEPKDKAEQQ